MIEGEGTDKFRRMACRAASLLSDSYVTKIGTLVMANAIPSGHEGKPVFSLNPNPLSVWLNLILVAMSTYQPGRFRGTTLAVDPYSASLAVFDHLLDRLDAPTDMDKPVDLRPIASRKFRVALSFPGERRDYVRKVADILKAKIGEVFYDDYFQADLARPNLDTLLQRIYHENSEMVVVFVCEHYERKEWCGLEWRAVRDLIKQRKDDDVMFLRFDDATISGLFSIDGYVDLRRFTPEETADLIVQRYKTRGVAS